MRSLLAITLLFFGLNANAEIVGVFVGFNNTEFDGPGDWDREFSWEFGTAYDIPIQNNFTFRTGAGIVQKASEADVINKKIEFVFLEVPATVMYRFNKYIAIFGGLNLDITLADDGAKSEAFALNIIPAGARFSWAPNHGMETFFEFGLTDIAEVDTKIGNSIAVRYRYEFNATFR